MPRKGYAWVFTPGAGGSPVPKHKQEEIRKRIVDHMDAKYGATGSYERIDVRFRGKYRYIDAYQHVEKGRIGAANKEARERQG